jgi:hypothetical protein
MISWGLGGAQPPGLGNALSKANVHNIVGFDVLIILFSSFGLRALELTWYYNSLILEVKSSWFF